jgi:hypothetical protein
VRLEPIFIAAAVILSAGCSREPDAYPPPFQRPAVGGEQQRVGRFVNMNDDNAGLYLVRDIQDNLEGTGWRWAHDRPELRFLLDKTSGLSFAMDFSFPEPNFKQTGPVTVTFFVNGRQLDKVRYATPGDKHFEKAVPAGWLRTGDYTVCRAEVDPPWVAPTDKVRLGFVLVRAGFVE